MRKPARAGYADGPRWLQPALAVFVSSLVAGLATAPIAAYHFNQIAQFGLIANLLSVPLMGTMVMPAAVLAVVLAPLGLASVGLWIMHLGLAWILGVAHFVAGLDGALRHVPTPDPAVLGLITLGGLAVVLWRGPLRWGGVLPMLVGFALWQVVDRPALLVAQSGSLLGVMTQAGRDVSKERGESFAAENWLENDGAPVPQSLAFARSGLSEEGRTVWADLGGLRVLNVRGATALAALDGYGGADVLITNQLLDQKLGCDVYDIGRLRETGALAGWIEEGGLRIVTARQVTGDWLWNTQNVRRRDGPLRTLMARLRAQ